MSSGLIISIAIGVVAILIEVVFFLWNRKERMPIWFYRTMRITGPGAKFPSDITIHFRGQPVPQVSVTELGFLNMGKGLIRESDVTRPIIVGFGDDVSILEQPVVVTPSRRDIDFSATLEGKGVKLSFDQLDYKDGAIVEIVHTGDEHTKVSLQGTIAGARKGIRQRSHVYAYRARGRAALALAALNLVMVALLLCAFCSDISQGRFSISAAIIVGCIVLLFILGFIWSLRQWIKRLPLWLAPRYP